MIKTDLQAANDKIILEPYHEPDTWVPGGVLIRPDPVKTDEPQQGMVIAAGPRAQVRQGDYVLYHPLRSVSLGLSFGEYVYLEQRDLVARAVGTELYPFKGYAMILPDWETKYNPRPDALVQLAPSDLEMLQPVKFGTVVRIGEGCLYAQPGDYVIIPPGIGAEAGFDTLYYFIKDVHLLAKLER